MYSRKRTTAAFLVMAHDQSTTETTLKVPVPDDMTEAERQVLLCRGCRKVFVEPRILACGHTLCASCISTRQLGGTVLCHECNHSQVVSRKKPDFRLQSFIGYVKEIKGALQTAGNRQP